MTSKANHNKIAEGLTRGMTNAKSALANSTKETKDMVTNAAYAAGSAIASGAISASEKASSAIEDCKRRWYNPLFLEDYQSEDFDMPKLVVIADEDIRKGNELCEGAIGWLNTRRIPEIIFMYEEFVPNSAIRFSPRPICGSAYDRHPFEPDLYLQVKDYLKICKRDQLTELKNIAYLLGATRCSVEVHQEKGLVGALGLARDIHVQSKLAGEHAGSDASQTLDAERSSNETLSIVMNESFDPGATPKRPDLQWFAHDNEILSLVEKRCSPDVCSTMNSYSIDITSSTASSISIDLASSIDASLGAAKVKAGDSLSATLKKEEKKRFIFKIEF